MYGTFDGVDLFIKIVWCHSGPNIICWFLMQISLLFLLFFEFINIILILTKVVIITVG